jgi:hypothetical protein
MRIPSLLTTLLLAPAACSGKSLDVGTRTTDAQSTSEAVPFPLVTSLTGRDTALGESVKKGAELAIDTINAAGGVRGNLLRLDVIDDGSDPAKAQASFAVLRAKGTPWGVGPLTTAAAVASNAELGAGTFVSPTVPLYRATLAYEGDEPPPAPGVSFGYPTKAAADAVTMTASEALQGVRRCSTIGLVTEKGADESLGAERIELVYKNLSLWVHRIEVPRDASDAALDAAASMVLDLKPQCQVLMLGDTLGPYLRIFQAATASFSWGPTTVLFRSMRDGLATSPVWTKPGASRLPQGSVVVAPLLEPNAERPPQTEAFTTRFAQRFGDVPDEASASAFDATMLLALALQRAGWGASRKALATALESVRVDGRRLTFTDGAELLRAAMGEDIAYRGVTGSVEGKAFLARDAGIFRKTGDTWVLEGSIPALALPSE